MASPRTRSSLAGRPPILRAASGRARDIFSFAKYFMQSPLILGTTSSLCRLACRVYKSSASRCLYRRNGARLGGVGCMSMPESRWAGSHYWKLTSAFGRGTSEYSEFLKRSGSVCGVFRTAEAHGRTSRAHVRPHILTAATHAHTYPRVVAGILISSRICPQVSHCCSSESRPLCSSKPCG